MKAWAATVLPFYKSHFSAQSLLLEPLRILMAVCLVVLLIVCANVANLLLGPLVGPAEGVQPPHVTWRRGAVVCCGNS